MRDFDGSGSRRRSTSLPRELDLAGRKDDVTDAGRNRHGPDPCTSATVYGNNVISGSAQVHQGDVYHTNYNTYHNSDAAASSRPQPKSYLSNSAMHIASGIAGGLVVAGLSGLMQSSRRPCIGSDRSCLRQDLDGVGAWLDDQCSNYPGVAGKRLRNTKGTDSSSVIDKWANTYPYVSWLLLEEQSSGLLDGYPERSPCTTSTPQYKEYFLPGKGIESDVIQSEIRKYLGDDASCRATQHCDDRHGYVIRACQALTTAMIEDLRERSARYARWKKKIKLRSDSASRTLSEADLEE